MFALERKKMVEEQIALRGVRDRRVLEAMRKVPRHLFVPPDQLPQAHDDEALPIERNQTISQPYIVAYMTEKARVGPGSRVLEIGTGSGYQTAVLAEIAREVCTVEIDEALAVRASERLKKLGYRNVKTKVGDGYRGWPGEAPFDAILVTAAPPEVPRDLLGQLKNGGRLIVPVGREFQDLWCITRTGSGFREEPLISVRFVPLVPGKKWTGG